MTEPKVIREWEAAVSSGFFPVQYRLFDNGNLQSRSGYEDDNDPSVWEFDGWDDVGDEIYPARDVMPELARVLSERRWIPVGERMPESDTRVLCYSEESGERFTAWILESGIRWDAEPESNGWINHHQEGLGLFVTHWQPLPVPPNA